MQCFAQTLPKVPTNVFSLFFQIAAGQKMWSKLDFYSDLGELKNQIGRVEKVNKKFEHFLKKDPPFDKTVDPPRLINIGATRNTPKA